MYMGFSTSFQESMKKPCGLFVDNFYREQGALCGFRNFERNEATRNVDEKLVGVLSEVSTSFIRSRSFSALDLTWMALFNPDRITPPNTSAPLKWYPYRHERGPESRYFDRIVEKSTPRPIP